jgi:peptide/nickel transport system permease protein
MTMTLWAVVTITFFLSYLVPGDPARLIAGATASPEQVELVRKELGLDRSVAYQYVTYLARVFRGDLGMSLQSRRAVVLDVRDYFSATLELSSFALVIALGIGVPLGVLSAVHRDSAFDHASRLFSLSGVSLPVFWLALILQLLFSQVLNILPLGGRVSTGALSFDVRTGVYLVDALAAADWGGGLGRRKGRAGASRASGDMRCLPVPGDCHKDGPREHA